MIKSLRWVLLVGGLVVAGALAVVRELPVDVFPEIMAPRVVIQTECGGLTAEEVEQFVTVPVESAMGGIPGVKAIRSSSGGGLSFVWVDFEWGTDRLRARYLVGERLAAVRERLPKEAESEIAPLTSVTGEIMMIALTSPGGMVDALRLREIGEYDLANRLMSVSGVGQVVVIGGSLPEYRIGVDPNRLAAYGLKIGDVVEAAESTRTMAGAGYLADVGAQELPLRQTARADTLAELRAAVVPAAAGRRLTLDHVADVAVAGAPRRGSASYRGRDCVLLQVQKAPGGNTPEMVKKLEAVVEEFRASRLPEGAEVATDAYNQADFIRVSIANGGRIVRDAVVVVAAVLGLTLLNARAVLTVLAAMPLSFALGLLLFPVFGLGVNIMTLGGLAVAVGDVVDSAIILVELANRKIRAAGEGADRWGLVKEALREVMPSMGWSTGLIALVFLPLLFLGGLEGQFFRPLGVAYLLVFGASLAVAAGFVPAMLAWGKVRGGGGDGGNGDGRVHRWLKAAYRPALRAAMKFPKCTLGVLGLAAAGAFWLAAGFGTSFLAPFKEDCYTVFVNTPPGTSLAETERVTRGVEERVAEIEGVVAVTRKTGRAEKDEHAEPVSASELLVRVDLEKEPERIRREIQKALKALPGVSTMIGYPIAHRISAVLSGTEAELAINLFGDDLEVLRAAAKEVAEELEKIPQVADARANREVMTETLRIRYRAADLARYGLTYKDAGEQVGAAFNGLVAGRVARNMQRWDVVVRLAEGARDSVRDVGEFRLDTPRGERPKLREVADVYREEASNLVIRDNGRRKALISCNVAEGSNPGELVKILEERVSPIAHRHGCGVTYGGSYEAQQSAARRLGVLSAALLLVVVGALMKTAGGGKGAALVLLNVPLALTGGIAAVWLAADGGPVLSVASLVGGVTVVGFVLRGGLLLVNRYRELMAAGFGAEEAARRGSEERMVPILMTSLTTVLGLLPLIRAAGEPGGELLAPLAVVQFGGLVSATALSLVALPAGFMLLFGKKR